MVKIPEYNQQINLSTAKIVDSPTPNLTTGLNSLRKDFESQQNLAETVGKLGQKLGQYAIEKKQIEQESADNNILTNYSKSIQDKMLSTDEETINVNGQEINRIKGVMNRQLQDADGSIVEFDDYNSQLKSSLLSGINDNDRRNKIETMMNRSYLGLRDNVISHEASQWRKGKVLENKQAVEQNVADAYAIRNVDALKNHLYNTVELSSTLNKVSLSDNNTAKKNLDNSVSRVVTNSVLGTLKETGDVNKAKGLLLGIKDSIPESEYKKIDDKINKSNNTIKRQLKQQAIVDRNNTRIDYISKIADGSISWDNVDESIQNIAIKDADLAEAVKKVVDSDGDYQNDESNDAFAGIVDNIFRSKNTEEINQFLLNALNDSASGKISKDKLSIVVEAAKNKGKSVEVDSGYKAIHNWFNSTGRKNINVLTHYMMLLKEGRQPKEAVDTAILRAQVEMNPNRIKYNVGDIVNTPNGGLKITGYDLDGEPIGDYIK